MPQTNYTPHDIKVRAEQAQRECLGTLQSIQRDRAGNETTLSDRLQAAIDHERLDANKALLKTIKDNLDEINPLITGATWNKKNKQTQELEKKFKAIEDAAAQLPRNTEPYRSILFGLNVPLLTTHAKKALAWGHLLSIALTANQFLYLARGKTLEGYSIEDNPSQQQLEGAFNTAFGRYQDVVHRAKEEINFELDGKGGIKTYKTKAKKRTIQKYLGDRDTTPLHETKPTKETHRGKFLWENAGKPSAHALNKIYRDFAGDPLQRLAELLKSMKGFGGLEGQHFAQEFITLVTDLLIKAVIEYTIKILIKNLLILFFKTFSLTLRGELMNTIKSFFRMLDKELWQSADDKETLQLLAIAEKLWDAEKNDMLDPKAQDYVIKAYDLIKNSLDIKAEGISAWLKLQGQEACSQLAKTLLQRGDTLPDNIPELSYNETFLPFLEDESIPIADVANAYSGATDKQKRKLRKAPWQNGHLTRINELCAHYENQGDFEQLANVFLSVPLDLRTPLVQGTYADPNNPRPWTENRINGVFDALLEKDKKTGNRINVAFRAFRALLEKGKKSVSDFVNRLTSDQLKSMTDLYTHNEPNKPNRNFIPYLDHDNLINLYRQPRPDGANDNTDRRVQIFTGATHAQRKKLCRNNDTRAYNKDIFVTIRDRAILSDMVNEAFEAGNLHGVTQQIIADDQQQRQNELLVTIFGMLNSNEKTRHLLDTLNDQEIESIFNAIEDPNLNNANDQELQALSDAAKDRFYSNLSKQQLIHLSRQCLTINDQMPPDRQGRNIAALKKIYHLAKEGKARVDVKLTYDRVLDPNQKRGLIPELSPQEAYALYKSLDSPQSKREAFNYMSRNAKKHVLLRRFKHYAPTLKWLKTDANIEKAAHDFIDEISSLGEPLGELFARLYQAEAPNENRAFYQVAARVANSYRPGGGSQLLADADNDGNDFEMGTRPPPPYH